MYKRSPITQQFIAEIDNDTSDNDIFIDGINDSIMHIKFSESQSPVLNDKNNKNSTEAEISHSKNVFLHIAHIDDVDRKCSYTAYISNNPTAYALLGSAPMSYSNCHRILVESGAVFSRSGYEHQYISYCRLTGTTPSIDEST